MMIEMEIGDDLIAGYIACKEQDKKTLALGTNMNRKEFEDCDLKLLEKYLNKKGYKVYYEKEDGHDFLFVCPLD